MARKSRRNRKKQQVRAVQAAAKPTPEPVQEQADFAEYSYVVRDLQRVALLACALFALLVVLSFVIP